MKLRARNNSESSQAIEDALRTDESAQAPRIAELVELKERRDAAVDAGDTASADEADRKILLATREVEAGERRIVALRDALEKAREREALDRTRSFVAAVRQLAETAGREKVRRRVEASAEIRDPFLAALSVVIREANQKGAPIGEPKIIDPTAGMPVGIIVHQDNAAQHAVALKVKELRAAASA